MESLLNYFLHVDDLKEFVDLYGAWAYGLLFVIVFAETGLVVTPFLPGDSLLFAVGALAASGVLNLVPALAVLVVAAVAGDAVNYAIGRFVGPLVFRSEGHDTFWHKLLNREHLQQAHEFFDRYGGKAVVLGRFVPIVRTFVPFVAGGGAMPYPQFAFYNMAGGVLWVGLCVGAGYAFGNTPIVKDHFGLVALGIVAVSLLPMLWGYVTRRREHTSRAGER
ncbi:MAG TPA: VTT domain-containing protein [Lacipirellulaceae bacterium]|jgi:membrane-associated protein